MRCFSFYNIKATSCQDQFLFYTEDLGCKTFVDAEQKQKSSAMTTFFQLALLQYIHINEKPHMAVLTISET